MVSREALLVCINNFILVVYIAAFLFHLISESSSLLIHVGNIISRFESKGYKLSALKLTTPPKSLLEEHYRDLASKPFFPKLMAYMTSGNA